MREERTLKENKDYQIKVRLTATEKEAVNNYCEKHGIATPARITELIDMAAKDNPEFSESYKRKKVKIREVADEIALLNKTNVELIKHGLIMSDRILDIIISAAVPQTTNYNKQGKNIETSGMSISSIVEDA